MSQQNVDVWRASIEDIRAVAGEEEWEGWLERAAELWHPEIEWDASELAGPGIGGVVYRGREEVRAFWRDWLSAWETLSFDYDLVDAGDRVVALVEDQRMRGRSSGVEVSLGSYAQVATFRDGLMVHWKGYESQAAALEAAGVAPDA